MIEMFQHYSKYARFDQEAKRRETWDETCTRVIDWFRAKLPFDLPFDRLHAAMQSERAMFSMRAVQMAGPPASRENVTLFNCAAAPIEDLKDMADALYIMMQGTGFAFSVERKYTEKLPVVAPIDPLGEVLTIIVDDTTESWCQSLLGALTAAYEGRAFDLDVTRVRPAGARLHTKGGYASGPGPLSELIRFAKDIIRGAEGRRLRPFEVHRIMCKIGQIVQVGGVRRAAMLGLSDIDDIEMREAKNGMFWNKYPELTMANNSAAYRDDSAWDLFGDEFANLIRSGSGERGIFTGQSKVPRLSSELFTNPCIVGDSWIETTDGPMRARDLVGRQFKAIVNGRAYDSTPDGFFYKGDKPIFRLTLTGGWHIRLTEDHKVCTRNRGKVPANELTDYDEIVTMDGLDTIESLVPDGHEAVYDCTIPGPAAYTANRILVSNCGEINLLGRQFCNLSIALIRPNDTREDIEEKVRLAAIMGTMQAACTDFKYIKPEWGENTRAEALLGVDLQGALDNKILQSGAFLKKLKAIVKDTNARTADLIGINRSAATTCIKPSGNSGERFGTGNAITGWFAPYYIRRAYLQAAEPMCRFLQDQGVECEDHYSDPTVKVFLFPKAAPAGAVIRGQQSAIDQLDWWLKLKVHWTEHNPSATIYVKDHEWDEVGTWIYRNRTSVGGLAFLPFSDHVYTQAPFTAISEIEYKAALARFPSIDWLALDQYDQGVDSTTAGQEFACTGDKCSI